ncbi:hypothetical protein CRUP_030824, partial [Coryphaenoides rupestris]
MRAPLPHAVRNQGMYPAARTLPEASGGPGGLHGRKAAPFPPPEERSPVRRTELPRSPHSRSGSSVSSRSYSPDRAKALPFTPQQGKVVDAAPEGHAADHLWGAHFPLHSGQDSL